MVKKLEIDALLFIIFGAFVGVFIVSYVKSQPVQFHSSAAAPDNFAAAPALNTPVPSVAPVSQTPVQKPTPQPLPTTLPTKMPSLAPIVSLLPVTSTTSQISPDGNQVVTIKTIENRDATQTDEIFTGTMTQPLYSLTLNTTESLSIPFNTWEPTDKYFFLQENSVEGEKILVFQANGQPFANGQSYLNLSNTFNQYGSPDTFDAATGWGGYDEIVINTKASDGSQGTSYWYELPEGSIIPLATKF
jgi:hypothetical protein